MYSLIVKVASHQVDVLIMTISRSIVEKTLAVGRKVGSF